MKKNVFVLMALCACSCISYAQDKVVLRTGESIEVKVVKSTNSAIEFTYPNEELVNEKSKKEISYIVYASGRKEECNQTFQVPVIKSKDDWEKVVVTHLASDVEGLIRVDEIAATSGWGGTLGSSKGYKDAIKKLKKKAAKLGAGVILVADRTNEIAAALGGGVQVVGVAYK